MGMSSQRLDSLKADWRTSAVLPVLMMVGYHWLLFRNSLVQGLRCNFTVPTLMNMQIRVCHTRKRIA